MNYAQAFSYPRLFHPSPQFFSVWTSQCRSCHSMVRSSSPIHLKQVAATISSPNRCAVWPLPRSHGYPFLQDQGASQFGWNRSSSRQFQKFCGPPCMDRNGIWQSRVKCSTVQPPGSLSGTEKSWSTVSTEEVGEALETDKEVGLAKEASEGRGSGRPEKPEMCTADELHYVPLPGTDWRLALWRYLPPKNATKRKHPLLMLSGIGTNAYCFDLSPNVSLARYLAEAGFDTWILEVRGAGLSKREGEPTAVELGGSDAALTGAVRDSLVGATIKGATRATPHMEKHVEDKHLKEGDERVTDDSSGGSNGAALDNNGTPAVDVNMGPSTEQEAHKAIEAKEEGTLEKEESQTSWLTSSITRMSERYKRLVRVNRTHLLSRKYVKQISSLLERGYRLSRIGRLQDSLKNLLDGRKSNSLITSQLSNATKSVAQFLDEGQLSVSPSVSSLKERFSNSVGNVQEIIELVSKYDWDFDNYLEEDVPAAMEYVRSHTNCPDGKLLTLGHSMGGIILYAMLATREDQAGIQGAVTVASSMEYGMSDSTLKLLLPFTTPAHLFNIPVIPLGILMTAVQPLVTRAPYPLAWIGYHVSAQGMMDRELFEKLVLTNFCTIPMKLLYQLASVFRPGGLKNRDGSVAYKDLLRKCQVPVMAIAGDHDMICPPPAVVDTAKVFTNGATYKLFGGQGNRHYAHYDLLCGRTAKDEVYPEILKFMIQCDD